MADDPDLLTDDEFNALLLVLSRIANAMEQIQKSLSDDYDHVVKYGDE